MLYIESHDTYATVLFILFAIFAALLLVLQIVFMTKMKRLYILTLPVLLLPIQSIMMSYRNFILYLGDNISSTSPSANIGYIANSLIIPIFVIIIYEASLHLHKVRSAHFFCIAFEDNGARMATATTWLVRFISAGLLAMNLSVVYECVYTARCNSYGGGYAGVIDHYSSQYFWLEQIPPMFLSLFGVSIGYVVMRYGKNLTMGLQSNAKWSFLFYGSICQIAGESFSDSLYNLTSSAGELALLISTTVVVWAVNEEFSIAGSFEDFLQRSNIAFGTLELQRTPPLNEMGAHDEMQINEQIERVSAPTIYAGPKDTSLEALDDSAVPTEISGVHQNQSRIDRQLHTEAAALERDQGAKVQFSAVQSI